MCVRIRVYVHVRVPVTHVYVYALPVGTRMWISVYMCVPACTQICVSSSCYHLKPRSLQPRTRHVGPYGPEASGVNETPSEVCGVAPTKETLSIVVGRPSLGFHKV